MARVAALKNYFQFNKGLITEATGLSYPENSMREATNIGLDYDGSISRRKGLELLPEGDNPSVGNNPYISSFLWKNAGASLDREFIVIRSNNLLFFYRSTSEKIEEALEGTLTIPASYSLEENISISSGAGYLFVAAKSSDTLYIEHKDGVFSFNVINPIIRDMDGIPFTEWGQSYRPTAAEVDGASPLVQASYYYNLYNQGWPTKAIPNWANNTRQDSAYIFLEAVGRYPSLTEFYVSGEDAGKYDPRPSKGFDASTTDPIRGKYLLEAYRPDRAGALSKVASKGTKANAITALLSASYPPETVTERPSSVGFYQGHLVMGSIANPLYASKLLVSQTIRGPEQFHKCHSSNDPTEDIESSPLDTDGGVLTISGLGHVFGFREVGQYLCIFTDNGVWAMSAGAGGMFSVNNLEIQKVTDVSATGAGSIVEIGGSVLYWGDRGIYSVSSNETGIGISASSVSESTIQSLYTDIPTAAKRGAEGILDTAGNKVYWLYKEGGDPLLRYFNKALILDLRLGSWYEYDFLSVQDKGLQLSSPFFKSDLATSSETYNVVANGDNVVANGDNVVVELPAETNLGYVPPSLVYVTIAGDRLRFSTLTDLGFVDWRETPSEYLFSSVAETGFDTSGEPGVNKQVSIMHTFFQRTENNFVSQGDGVGFDYPSSCFMTVKWDWDETGDGNRWGRKEQVYRFTRPYIPTGPGTPFDYSHSVISTRNKVRGRGKSLSFRFESEPRKDFVLLGWAIEYTAASKL